MGVHSSEWKRKTTKNIKRKFMKICTVCKKSLPFSEFFKDSSRNDGYNASCKSCKKIHCKLYRETHPDKMLEIRKKYKEDNPDYQKLYLREYRTRDYVKAQKREYRQRPEIKKRKLEQMKQRRSENLNIRLNYLFSKKINNALKRKNVSKLGVSWKLLLGYDANILKTHLESLFQPGMSWDNYGKFGWHIDHIIPQSSFVFSSIYDSQFKTCWSLDNLQPLWWYDNLAKRNTIFGHPFKLVQDVIMQIQNDVSILELQKQFSLSDELV